MATSSPLTKASLEASRAMCEAIGLSPDNVTAITIRMDAPGSFEIEARLTLHDREAGQLVEELRRFKVISKERGDAFDEYCRRVNGGEI